MRTFLVGLAGGLVALVGFAGSASALASIDLIWADTLTSDYMDPTGSIVLNVVLNTGAGPASRGGGITVDYSLALAEVTFVSATNSTNPLFTLGSPAGAPLNNGTQVTSLNAVSFLALPASTSIVLATITFSVTPGAPGVLNFTTLFTGLDDIDQMDLAGGFGTASITRTPEPGTLSLLVMGLGGLYAVGRRQRR
jgi:hypothetical protein